MDIEPIHIERDVTFGSANGRDLKLDLYWPEDVAATRTAVLLVHGGGWRAGHRAMMTANGEALARLGYLGVAIEYRLLGESPWPAQLDDVKLAVSYVASHADSLGIDPGRIVLQGFSAGAHLSLMAAADLHDDVAAVVSLFPPVELVTTTPGEGQAAAAMLLSDPSDAAAARHASPLHRVAADYPPTFLIHGAEDWLSSPVASLRMYEALMNAGVKTELHIYAGHTHEFAVAPYMLQPVHDEIALFLQRIVVDPEGARQDDLAHNPMFANGPEAFHRRMAELNQT